VIRQPAVVWLGTGEANASGDSYDGVGIFRSSDGGANWASMDPDSYHINASSWTRRLQHHLGCGVRKTVRKNLSAASTSR